jgi:hypothetical protein
MSDMGDLRESLVLTLTRAGIQDEHVEAAVAMLT